ncbi:hypothetical protein SAMN02745121_00453 [Nannocystis exedens]|uniref:Uncharacterized protein n=1 Tax=Nannocystis exedens TaxID=54 RepID=A0A1I1T313_9BACT|nr:hypothetical protein [Nannocystis exedens]PCC66816.1 hypothetical protein NAEX_09412 [Nannocystis exedens]SFD53001.1 hypothetical protein SAMN02745121_00453 [Nannocystis exedens]
MSSRTCFQHVRGRDDEHGLDYFRAAVARSLGAQPPTGHVY